MLTTAMTTMVITTVVMTTTTMFTTIMTKNGDGDELSLCKRSAADIRASCKSRRDVAAFHFDSTSDWQMWATLALNQLAEKAK